MEKKPTFEEAYEKLAQIAEKLENPEVSLDESIRLFEEGIALSKYCSETLENAKQRIETLQRDQSGELSDD